MLVGDAFGFLDPLYSSGVLLALKSGELAADAIVDGLAKGDTSAAQLGAWGANFNSGVDRMRRLVCEYYDGLQLRRVRQELSRAARHRHRPADRRSVRRSRGQGVGADGVALPAGEVADSGVDRGDDVGRGCRTRRTS